MVRSNAGRQLFFAFMLTLLGLIVFTAVTLAQRPLKARSRYCSGGARPRRARPCPATP